MEDRYRYLRLDAKVEKVRDGGGFVRERLVVAHAVHETRRSEVIGLDVGDANTDTFLTAFGLGVVGVQLAISDACQGLKAAVMALSR